MSVETYFRLENGRPIADRLANLENIPTDNEKSAVALVSGFSFLDYRYKCGLDWLTVSTVRINTGKASADDASIIMNVSSPLTIDITISGKNGLDSGNESNSTWYYVWLIYNQTTSEVSGLFSTNGTSPTLPSGFTKKRLLGTIRNNYSANFLKVDKITTIGRVITYYQEDADSTLRALVSGNSPSYSTVSLSAFCPPTGKEAILVAEAENKEAGIRKKGETEAIWRKIKRNTISTFSIVPNSAQEIEYFIDSGVGAYLNIGVVGYVEEL